MAKYKCEKCNSESEEAQECCGQPRAEVTEETSTKGASEAPAEEAKEEAKEESPAEGSEKKTE